MQDKPKHKQQYTFKLFYCVIDHIDYINVYIVYMIYDCVGRCVAGYDTLAGYLHNIIIILRNFYLHGL